MWVLTEQVSIGAIFPGTRRWTDPEGAECAKPRAFVIQDASFIARQGLFRAASGCRQAQLCISTAGSQAAYHCPTGYVVVRHDVANNETDSFALSRDKSCRGAVLK
jgi:hypothetical protein